MNVPRQSIVVAPMLIAISDEKRLGYEKSMVELLGSWRQTPQTLAPDDAPIQTDTPAKPTPPAQPTPPRDDEPKPQQPTWPEPVPLSPDAQYPTKKPKKN